MARLRKFILILFYIALKYVRGQEKLLVETKTGLVAGMEAVTVDSKKPYYAYKGIPYAEPPIGDLRFSPPIPAKNWLDILNATQDKSACTQDISSGSEDCLYINVYTPKSNSSNLLPVMVWIYGGYFLEGSSQYIEYGPDYFLEEEVIVVTFNYRLGVLGFLSTADVAAPGNWGLKDQLLALKWVHENIQNFGGNASRVTLFGESAGSASVSYLVQTPLTKDLFQNAIMQSGTSLNLWAFSRDPRSTAFRVGRALGIITTNSTYLIQQLRQVDSRRLQRVSMGLDLGETILTNPRDGLIFAPCIEPALEGAVVLDKSHKLLKNGGYNKIPMIVGFTSQESLPFVKALERVRLYLLSYDLLPSRIIPIDMNVSPNPFTQAMLTWRIRRHYLNLTPLVLNEKQLVQYVTDDQFIRPVNEAVRLMSNGTNVYYYRFSYVGPLGLQAGQSERITSGVGHAEDLNYLWRRATNIIDFPNEDTLTRLRLIRLWTNFAKTSNPTPVQDHLLQNVTWISATPEQQYYFDIGSDLKMESDLSPYSISWWSNLYKEYGNPPFDTY